MPARTLAIALLLATATAKIGNVDCGNGNMCPERMTCASPHRHSLNHTAMVGRKYGCAPFPHASLCPGHRFSCPTGSKCMRDKKHGDLSCVSAGSAPKKPTQNVNALAKPSFLALAPQFAPGNGFCAVIGDDLPSECTCTDDSANLGGTIDCTEDVVVDTIGVRGTITPCGGEAEAKLTIYETDIGFSYSKGIEAGEEIAQFPIPGLSVDVPIVGSCGVYAGLSFSGDASALTLSGTLDVCGTVLGVQECGSSIYSGLPIDVIDGTWDFSDICTGPSGGSKQAAKTLTTTDACAETTQSACDAASGCTWCKCAALPSKCWTKEDAAKLPAGVYVCDSTKPTFLRGAKIATV